MKMKNIGRGAPEFTPVEIVGCEVVEAGRIVEIPKYQKEEDSMFTSKRYYTVFFESEPNYHVSHWQMENTRMRSRAFDTIEAAKEFAVRMDGEIYDWCGRRV